MNWNNNNKPNVEINLEDIFKRIFGGGSNGGDGQKSQSKIIFFIALLIIAFIGVRSSFYQIQTDESGVLTRFGKYQTTKTPGLHFKLPFGVDKVYKVKTTILHQETFGFTSVNQTRSKFNSPSLFNYSKLSSYRRDDGAEASMLTGDLNVIEVKWVVLYKISDPKAYLFNIANPEKNIRDISQATMRQVVGDRMVGTVMHNFSEVEFEVKTIMQKVLDTYNMGVVIQEIKVQSVEPPEVVRPAFNEVNAAKQEQERDINLAEKERNRIIPRARGRAEQEISEAKGYATAIVNRAEGDANRISALLKEYESAPKVTKVRLYYDLIQHVLRNTTGLTVIDPDLKGIMPIYNDNKMSNKTLATLEAEAQNE